jgi:hypothetical protein
MQPVSGAFQVMAPCLEGLPTRRRIRTPHRAFIVRSSSDTMPWNSCCARRRKVTICGDGGWCVLIRALALYALVAGITAVAVLAMVPLPEIPLLRYVVYATPLIGAIVVVREWYETARPGLRPTPEQRRPVRTAAGARIVWERLSSAR